MGDVDMNSGASVPKSEDTINTKVVLEDAGLVISYPKNWVEAEQINSIRRLKLVITICSICLIIELWPIQFFPLMFSFFWWVSIRGYLTLWEVTK